MPIRPIISGILTPLISSANKKKANRILCCPSRRMCRRKNFGRGVVSSAVFCYYGMGDENGRTENRKTTRLKGANYNRNQAVFFTICTQNRRCVLSRIVGREQAPAETDEMVYTTFGKIAAEQICIMLWDPNMRFSKGFQWGNVPWWVQGDALRLYARFFADEIYCICALRSCRAGEGAWGSLPRSSRRSVSPFPRRGCVRYKHG